MPHFDRLRNTPMTCGNCGIPLSHRVQGGTPYPCCPRCHALWPDPHVLALVHTHRRRPPPGSVVSLVHEPNGTAHNDLVLRVGTWASRSDSYYYGLDHVVGSSSAPVESVRTLLTGWRTALEACDEGQTAWLPHDFSDQYSGWLRCRRRGDGFDVVDGWSGLEGWAFYPSDFEGAVDRLADFTPHVAFGDPLWVRREQLLSDVEASLSDLAHVGASA